MAASSNERGSSSGSRAIQIPHLDSPFSDSPSTYEYRRRRRGRHSKIPSPVERTTSEAGPSSSLGSDSSWNSPSIGIRPDMSPSHRALGSRDPRLPTSMAMDTNMPTTPQRKDKAKAVDHPLPPLFPPATSPLSPSMLDSSSYKSINLNSHHDDPDEPPRLITYTKSGQGFTWNDELFLPSYMIGRYSGRGRRKQYDGDFGEDEVEVAEIFITDEEAAAMMP